MDNTVFLPVFLLFKNSKSTTRCKPALYDEILLRQFNSTKRAHMIIMYSWISLALERALSQISRIFLNLEMVQFISSRESWTMPIGHLWYQRPRTDVRIRSVELGKAVSKQASPFKLYCWMMYPHQHWKLQSVIRIADPYHMK